MNATNAVYLKIVIVGDGGCGKSALLMSYTNKKFPDEYIPTVVDNYDVLLALGEGQNLKLSIVDTAGQEEFKNIRALNYSGTHVVIICYSCDNKASLDNVKSLWLKEIRIDDQNTPFVLVGNKYDKVKRGDPSAVTPEEAAAVCRKLGGWASLQCSAKQYGQSQGRDGKVEEVFKAAIKCGLHGKGFFDDAGCCAACTLM